ncbi:hypothetical protein SRABI106_02794 [Rahnella aquatilis]|nr:hypothetical protein SRABI106_02794 [Rahnella aquatilis]
MRQRQCVVFNKIRRPAGSQFSGEAVHHADRFFERQLMEDLIAHAGKKGLKVDAFSGRKLLGKTGGDGVSKFHPDRDHHISPFNRFFR